MTSSGPEGKEASPITEVDVDVLSEDELDDVGGGGVTVNVNSRTLGRF